MAWMRTHVAIAVVLAATAAAAVVLGTAGQAAAQNCGGSSNIFDGGAGADAFCAGGLSLIHI